MKSRHWLFRLATSAAVMLSVVVLSAVPAQAATNAAARSWGFKCSADFNWVHQNWPNISVASQANQYVYTQSWLYRWNGQAWVRFRVSQQYVGISNVTGRKLLGYDVYGSPYWFAIAGNPSLVAANDGYNFTYLPDGAYATLERYWAGGHYWSAWSYWQWNYNVKYCVI